MMTRSRFLRKDDRVRDKYNVTSPMLGTVISSGHVDVLVEWDDGSRVRWKPIVADVLFEKVQWNGTKWVAE